MLTAYEYESEQKLNKNRWKWFEKTIAQKTRLRKLLAEKEAKEKAKAEEKAAKENSKAEAAHAKADAKVFKAIAKAVAKGDKERAKKTKQPSGMFFLS